MLDSLLTLTRRGAFWLVLAWVVVVLLDRGLSAMLGRQEPIFILAAIFIPLVLLVSGTYTLIKWIVHRIRHEPPSNGAPDAE